MAIAYTLTLISFSTLIVAGYTICKVIMYEREKLRHIVVCLTISMAIMITLWQLYKAFALKQIAPLIAIENIATYNLMSVNIACLYINIEMLVRKKQQRRNTMNENMRPWLTRPQDNNSDSGIINVDIDKLHDFHTGEAKHVFEVEYDNDMIALEEQIKNDGILEPIIIRADKEFPGEYEVITGHRRKFIAAKLGYLTMKATLLPNISDQDAIKLMVVSNLTKRETIKPSVKARAYKAYLDANKRHGQRTDLTFDQVGQKLDTTSDAAEEFNDSRTNIRRYVRLNYLTDDLKEFVDTGDLKLTTAVELSYLDPEEQDYVLNEIIAERVNISLDQASEIKAAKKESGSISVQDIHNILKPQKKQIVFKLNEAALNKILPDEVKKLTAEQKYDYIREAIASHIQKDQK